MLNSLLLAIALAGQIEPITAHETVLTESPAVIRVVVEADDYTWFLPAGVTVVEDTGSTLKFTALPGTYQLRCKTLTIDWDARKLNPVTYVATFIVGGKPDEPDAGKWGLESLARSELAKLSGLARLTADDTSIVYALEAAKIFGGKYGDPSGAALEKTISDIANRLTTEAGKVWDASGVRTQWAPWTVAMARRIQDNWTAESRIKDYGEALRSIAEGLQ